MLSLIYQIFFKLNQGSFFSRNNSFFFLVGVGEVVHVLTLGERLMQALPRYYHYKKRWISWCFINVTRQINDAIFFRAFYVKVVYAMVVNLDTCKKWCYNLPWRLSDIYKMSLYLLFLSQFLRHLELSVCNFLTKITSFAYFTIFSKKCHN